MAFPNIKIIGEILTSISENVGHYEAMQKTDKYFVWAEDMESSAENGDNRKISQAIQGTIDYFTKEEYDPAVSLVQEKLVENGISFRLNSIQYEDDTEYIHYEWIWEVS